MVDDRLISHRKSKKYPYNDSKTGITMVAGLFIGFLIGICIKPVRITQEHIISPVEDSMSGLKTHEELNVIRMKANRKNKNNPSLNSTDIYEFHDPSNPKGTETLPSAIIESESDLYPRRLWGNPNEDLKIKPKYLVTFTVGVGQKKNIDAAVKKFPSGNFSILLFHYDGRSSEWDDEFEWSRNAIHVNIRNQTKWWFAKRFLHPDVVAPYEYIFMWDEDLGVNDFDAEEYVKVVKKRGLEISQPGLGPVEDVTATATWEITKRRTGSDDVHTLAKEKPGRCIDPRLPPCAAFVEIMATVFSRDSWRCVWHMIQNDLVHGWGLDLALRNCAVPAHEKMGVVDSQWVVHQKLPTLRKQVQSMKGKLGSTPVDVRCRIEWQMFQARLSYAEKTYMQELKRKQERSKLVFY